MVSGSHNFSVIPCYSNSARLMCQCQHDVHLRRKFANHTRDVILLTIVTVFFNAQKKAMLCDHSGGTSDGTSITEHHLLFLQQSSCLMNKLSLKQSSLQLDHTAHEIWKRQSTKVSVARVPPCCDTLHQPSPSVNRSIKLVWQVAGRI